MAGVAVIVVMIPINSVIAKRINTATAGMMTAKDARIRFLTEAIRGMKSLKMLGFEAAILGLSAEKRAQEMGFLSSRKYLDAVCVLLWASMPVLVPFITFTTTALLGRHLTASEVREQSSECFKSLVEVAVGRTCAEVISMSWAYIRHYIYSV